MKRTSEGLRDILFDEIDQLRGPNGDPQRALAVSNVARQIVNTVRVEMDYAKNLIYLQKQGGDVELGTLRLGDRQSAQSAAAPAMARSSVTRRRAPAK